MNIQLIGGEGGGKTTVIDRLRAENVFPGALYVRQPGGTPIAEAIRDKVLFDKTLGERPTPWTQFHLFMAARCQLWDKVLRQANAEGKLLISDRGEDGTCVYQCICQLGIDDPQWYVNHLKEVDIPLPDLTIRFDIDPNVGLARKQGDAQSNFFDEEKLAFHYKIQVGYDIWTMYLIQHGFAVETVDASKPADEVYEEVKRIITAHL